MIRQRVWIAVDAAVSGGHVGHPASRLHVAILTLPALARGGTGLPFRKCAVDVDAEDDAFMARGAVAAVAVERRIRILAAIHVVERAEKQLPLGGTH